MQGHEASAKGRVLTFACNSTLISSDRVVSTPRSRSNFLDFVRQVNIWSEKGLKRKIESLANNLKFKKIDSILKFDRKKKL